MTHRLYLNDDWLFTEQFEDSLVAPEYPENTLQPVRLPHTCKEPRFIILTNPSTRWSADTGAIS